MGVIEDIEEIADKLFGKFWREHDRRRFQAEEMRHTEATSGVTSATGALNLEIFKNKTDYIFDIVRIGAFADGYDPHTVWENAGTYAWFYIGGANSFNMSQVVDYLPNDPGSQVFPNIATYPRNVDPRLHPNESISMQLVGGPMSTNVTIVVSGFLTPRKFKPV